MSKEAITLYYREGGSDKVYNASIEEVPGGYEVHFSYGRRGSSLTLGKKTTFPVSLVAAEKIYNKLVSEKTSKGYKETGISTDMASSLLSNSLQVIDSGVRPQLLNEVDEKDLEYYLTSDEWCSQEKHDGRRRLLIVKDLGLTATNRKGFVIALETLKSTELLMMIAGNNADIDVIVDTEDMGDMIYAFDIVNFDLTYKERYLKLLNMIPGAGGAYGIQVVYTAWTTANKRAMLEDLKEHNAEGIVFKKVDSLYVPGRPNSGGDQLKYKFIAHASCKVIKTNPTKRSVELAVYDNGKEISVGNATVYPNMEIPVPGTLVELKYLYYFAGGSLFQPVLLGPREDIDIEDCTLKQLKLKR